MDKVNTLSSLNTLEIGRDDDIHVYTSAGLTKLQRESKILYFRFFSKWGNSHSTQLMINLNIFTITETMLGRFCNMDKGYTGPSFQTTEVKISEGRRHAHQSDI